MLVAAPLKATVGWHQASIEDALDNARPREPVDVAGRTGAGQLLADEITEMVRQSIGVDFLGYNDAENLADAVGIPKDSMCFTCSSGNYDSLGINPDFSKSEQIKAK